MLAPSKIVFVCDNMPLSSNHSGAASFKYSHLKLLIACFPKTKLYLIVLDYYCNYTFNTNELFEEHTKVNLEVIRLNLKNYATPVLQRKLSLLSPTIKGIQYFYTFINDNAIDQFKKVIDFIKPDIIWTEHLVENYFALSAKLNTPIVFSHHDFLWKIRKIKQKNGIPNYIKTSAFRSIENRIIKKNKYIVSGSFTELEEIKKINPKSTTVYLPANYIPVNTRQKTEKNNSLNIVHLGTMKATANKKGLERFIQVCWPVLCELPQQPHLIIIGDLNGAPRKLLSLLNHPSIQCLGFVENLSNVLNPYDIHIIPYEHDTGTRTRVPLALNYNQTLISTTKASNGIKGLKNMENCILVDTLEDMSKQIEKILQGETDYKTVADNGKKLFEKEFTLEEQKKEILNFFNKM